MSMGLERGKMVTERIADEQLLEAQSHVWKHFVSFIDSMALKCAIQLGIPDAIHRHGPHPIPLSLLVSSLQLQPNRTPFIFRLMRLLTHSGFFTTQTLTQNNATEEEEEEKEEEEVGYMLTNSSRLLLKDNPCAVTPLILFLLQPAHMEPWQSLSAWFQTQDRTPFDTVYKMSFWEYMGNNPKDSDDFNAAMTKDSSLVICVLLGKYKGHLFDGLGSLVDVGGGTGTVAKAIAKAFPQIECSVLDLPQVVADLKGEENFTYVEGDMFKAIPPADALLLKWILHNWNDEECVKILKNCRAAITGNGNKGKVIVIDMVVGRSKKDPIMKTQLSYDMMMMTFAGGREREEREWAQLIKEAGFVGYNIFPIMRVWSLIEIYP